MKIEHSLREVEIMALEMDPPVLVDADTPVAKVIEALREHGEGCALLIEDDRLIGIFTERDVLLKVLGTPGAGQRPVRELMTGDPVCVRRRDPISLALLRMQQGGFRSLPVVDEEHRVVACVRHKDLGRYVVQHLADRLLNLPPDPDQIARRPEGG
jgi:CBS domain-containing protein